MDSICIIEISDDEDVPKSVSNTVPADFGSKVNGSHVSDDNDANSIHSAEEHDHSPEENDVDVRDISLHASDLEEEDIFAENLNIFKELKRQADERLASEPMLDIPPPDSPSGADKRAAPKTDQCAKRAAPKIGRRRKRQRTKSGSSSEDEDDDLKLEKLLATSPVVPPSGRRTRSRRAPNAPASQPPRSEDIKLVERAESPLVLSDSPLPEEKQPEPEPSFTARVLAGTRVIRLRMKRTDRLRRLFDAVADELSLPSRRVCLGQRDVIYSPHQTPDDVGLGPFDMIEFWEGVSDPPPGAAAAPVDADSVELKVQSANRRSTVMIQLRKDEPMSLLMKRYAREKDVPLSELRFRFDGESLDPTETPESLDLEGGECIDVHGC